MGNPTRAPRSSPTVIFLHIGKTAGTTLRKILYRNFEKDEVVLVKNGNESPARLRREETPAIFAAIPEMERARAKLVLGHIIFGLHDLVPQPSTYITLVRRPTSLVVSQYHWVRRDPTHWLHARVVEADMSLEEYVEGGISLESDNSQTRAIAGDTTTPFGECTGELLDTAKRNVDRHFSVVGLTERFDESLLLLRHAFGWSKMHYAPAKVAPRRDRPSVPRPVLDRIEALNWLDDELYEYAQHRMQQAIEADPRFEADLRRFRRSNSLYRRTWGAVTYTVPKSIMTRSGGTPSRG